LKGRKERKGGKKLKRKKREFKREVPYRELPIKIAKSLYKAGVEISCNGDKKVAELTIRW